MGRAFHGSQQAAQCDPFQPNDHEDRGGEQGQRDEHTGQERCPHPALLDLLFRLGDQRADQITEGVRRLAQDPRLERAGRSGEQLAHKGFAAQGSDLAQQRGRARIGSVRLFEISGDLPDLGLKLGALGRNRRGLFRAFLRRIAQGRELFPQRRELRFGRFGYLDDLGALLFQRRAHRIDLGGAFRIARDQFLDQAGLGLPPIELEIGALGLGRETLRRRRRRRSQDQGQNQKERSKSAHASSSSAGAMRRLDAAC